MSHQRIESLDGRADVTVDDVQAFRSAIEAQLAGNPDEVGFGSLSDRDINDGSSAADTDMQVPAYSHDSTPLSLVRFRCMLQDTGYPMEVYMDGDIPASGSSMDVGNLKERWVGWAVEYASSLSKSRRGSRAH